MVILAIHLTLIILRNWPWGAHWGGPELVDGVGVKHVFGLVDTPLRNNSHIDTNPCVRLISKEKP